MQVGALVGVDPAHGRAHSPVERAICFCVDPFGRDFSREGRLYLVDPAPIPADEMQRTYEWMRSWDFLETGCDVSSLINQNVQKHGYQKAEHEAL